MTLRGTLAAALLLGTPGLASASGHRTEEFLGASWAHQSSLYGATFSIAKPLGERATKHKHHWSYVVADVAAHFANGKDDEFTVMTGLRGSGFFGHEYSYRRRGTCFMQLIAGVTHRKKTIPDRTDLALALGGGGDWILTHDLTSLTHWGLRVQGDVILVDGGRKYGRVSAGFVVYRYSPKDHDTH